MIINLIFFFGASLLLAQEINDAKIVPSLKELALIKVAHNISDGRMCIHDIQTGGWTEFLKKELAKILPPKPVFKEIPGFKNLKFVSDDHTRALRHVEAHPEIIDQAGNVVDIIKKTNFIEEGAFVGNDLCIFSEKCCDKSKLRIYQKHKGLRFSSCNTAAALCTLGQSLCCSYDGDNNFFNLFQFNPEGGFTGISCALDLAHVPNSITKLRDNLVALGRCFEPNAVVYIYDYREHKIVREINIFKIKTNYCTSIVSDENNLLAVIINGDIKLFDTAQPKGKEYLKTFSCASGISSVKFDKTSSYLIAISSNYAKVQFFNIATGDVRIPWIFPGQINYFSVSTNNSLLIKGVAGIVGTVHDIFPKLPILNAYECLQEIEDTKKEIDKEK